MNPPALEALRGCSGKPADKNRMNDTPFSHFIARLREFIRVSRDRGRTAQTFEELAMDLFQLQLRRNPAYRRICEARRAKPRHWSEVPTVPTSAFKELELSCLGPAERTAVFHSSGTTELRPSRHFHSLESLGIYEDAVLGGIPRDLRPAEGARDVHWERLLILTPPRRQAPHSSLVYMFHIFRREFGTALSLFLGSVADDGAWLLDLEAAAAAVREAVSEGRPALVLGTAFSYMHLLDHLESSDSRFQLPLGSRALETGGYKGRSRSVPKSELHRLIELRLGIPQKNIFCEYGMSELSSQAYDSPATDTRLFRFPPWARVVIVSPETGREVSEGETGLIHVFDLANVFSVMAIQTEDLAVRHGHGFELLGRAQLAEPRGCSLMPA